MRQTQNTQKNSNKKSVFVIALLLLLVAVIGFGGYTMSKYISSKSHNGTANVAKWGFTVSADASKLFGKNYEKTGASSTVSEKTNAAELTVQANGERIIVAPGTTGSMTFSITGTAEVKSHVDINFNVDSDVVLKYTKDSTPGTYNPIKWTLKKDGTAVTGAENVALAQIATVLNGYNADADVEANETYAHAGSYTLEWAWAFESGNDALDTFLGKIAAGYAEADYNDGTNTYTKVDDGTSTEINFTLSISVTQLQQ